MITLINLSGVRRLTSRGHGLSQKAVRAAFWATGIRVGMRGSTLIRTLVLARLLAPGDFGLMGIALLMLALMERFTQTGFRPALVQRQGDIRPYLDTAWTIEVLRGFGIGLFLVAAAPFIAAFFNVPEAELVVKVMAAAMVIRGFINIGIVYFQKDLDIRSRFKYEMAGVIVDVGVSIGLAVALQSIWALVYGALAGSVAMVVSSYVFHSYRPRLRLDWPKARELYGFGKWVLGYSALEFLRENLDQLLVGKMLGATSLGLYQVAFKLSQLVGKELTQIARQVVFPSYSKMQEQHARLQKAYIEATQMVALIAFPLSIGAFVLAPRLVPVVLGENWVLMVPGLQVLSIAGLLRSLNASADVLFQGIGRPDITTKLDLATLIILVALIYPFIQTWGLVGAAASVLVSSALVYPFRIGLALGAIGCDVRSYLKILFVPLVSSFTLMGAVLFAEARLADQPSALQVIWLVFVGMAAYLSAGVVVDHISGRAVRRALMHRISMG